MKMINPIGHIYRNTHLLLILLISLPIIVLLNFGGIKQSILRLSNQELKVRLLEITAPLEEFITHYGIDRPEKFLREQFLAFSGWKIEERVRPQKLIYKVGRQNTLPFSERNPFNLLVVGDSLAGGVEFALKPLCEKDPSIDLTINPVVASTLANQHFIDWPQKFAELLAVKRYDLVLIYLGGNSAQGIYLADRGRAVVFPDDDWAVEYKSRVRNFIGQGLGNGADVAWIALPPMRDMPYRENIKIVSRKIEEVCAELDVPVIEVTPVIGLEGVYSDWLTIDGTAKRVRTDDGMHFTYAGSEVISKHLIGWIHERYHFSSAVKE